MNASSWPNAPPPATWPASAAGARQVRALREGGESIADLVTSYSVSRATIYRALAATEPAPAHQKHPLQHPDLRPAECCAGRGSSAPDGRPAVDGGDGAGAGVAVG